MEIKTEKYNLQIRKGSIRDLRFCHDLARRNMESYVEKYWGGWNSKRYRNDFQKKSFRIIILNGRRIGFCNYEKREEEFFVLDMQLSGNFQGKGIGKSILAIIEKEARKKKMKKIKLEVFKDNPARKLYEATGFREIQNKEHSLVMEKKIK